MKYFEKISQERDSQVAKDVGNLVLPGLVTKKPDITRSFLKSIKDSTYTTKADTHRLKFGPLNITKRINQQVTFPHVDSTQTVGRLLSRQQSPIEFITGRGDPYNRYGYQLKNNKRKLIWKKK